MHDGIPVILPPETSTAGSTAGATKPAAELIQDFPGRPQNMDALKNWMGEEFKTTATRMQSNSGSTSNTFQTVNSFP